MLNKIQLIGHIGSDPEMNFTASGSAVANISLATTRKWKDKVTGEKKKQVEWHRIVFFNRLAEVVGEYLKSGSLVYIEGRIQTRKWQDQSGQDRYTTEIVANEMQMLGHKQPTAEQRTSEPQAPRQDQSASQTHPDLPNQNAPNPDDFDDDIPF